MCSHRNWFSSYQSIDGGVVLMGNTASCKTIGIGSIKIKMFDGVVKMLVEVRHILELKNNLVSLRFLDSSGYNFSCQGGVLRVSNGSLVIMEATKVGNLYRLEGNTKINEVGVVSNESTHLWHSRLGHISEKGQKLLIEKLRWSLASLGFQKRW
ncbi:hypothetical protein SUGI_1022100 [Cryptomeria japonica]|nr:hypothetical protein SUGI_1022100 [Cryptomeria japonica]